MRPLRIVVPFKLNGAKSRLSSILSAEERRILAFAMLEDVLAAVYGFGDVTVLSRPGLDRKEIDPNVAVLESDLELNDALNSLIGNWASLGWQADILIAMADLALLRSEDIKGMLQTEGDVVLSPGRGGGTNMILIRSSLFRTCYRGLSFPKHLDNALELGLPAGIYASFNVSCDIDEPDDLTEVLIHGGGRTRNVLKSMGFSLSEKGRAKLARTANSNKL